VGDSCVDERLSNDVAAMQMLYSINQKLAEGESLRKQGFTSNDQVDFGELKERLGERKADWDIVFNRIGDDHLNAGFVKGPSGF